MRPLLAAKLVDAVEAPPVGRYDDVGQVTIDAVGRPVVSARVAFDTLTEAERDPGDPADPPDARHETVTKVVNDPADVDTRFVGLETETRVVNDPGDASLAHLETATAVKVDPYDFTSVGLGAPGSDDLATGVVAY